MSWQPGLNSVSCCPWPAPLAPLLVLTPTPLLAYATKWSVLLPPQIRSFLPAGLCTLSPQQHCPLLSLESVRHILFHALSVGKHATAGHYRHSWWHPPWGPIAYWVSFSLQHSGSTTLGRDWFPVPSLKLTGNHLGVGMGSASHCGRRTQHKDWHQGEILGNLGPQSLGRRHYFTGSTESEAGCGKKIKGKGSLIYLPSGKLRRMQG